MFPIIIGTCAFSLGKKVKTEEELQCAFSTPRPSRPLARSILSHAHADALSATTPFHQATDTETHRWTLYVRGPNGEDLSSVLAKVEFHLHPTFHNPVRTLTAHPFELTETGWGEFELACTLHWVEEAGEPPIELTHKLKLYADDGSEPATAAAAAQAQAAAAAGGAAAAAALPDPTMTGPISGGAAGAANPATPAKRPVVSEQYDEVVFSEPRAAFWKKVSAWAPPPAVPPLSTAAHCPPVSSAEDVRRLAAARTRVAQVRAALLKQLEQYGGVPGGGTVAAAADAAAAAAVAATAGGVAAGGGEAPVG